MLKYQQVGNLKHWKKYRLFETELVIVTRIWEEFKYNLFNLQIFYVLLVVLNICATIRYMRNRE